MVNNPFLGVAMLLRLVWDLALVFVIEITAFFFLCMSVWNFSLHDQKSAAEALFAAAVLWALRGIRKAISLGVRLKEYEIDKPAESVVLLMRDREPEWRAEYMELKKKAGLPEWWGSV